MTKQQETEEEMRRNDAEYQRWLDDRNDDDINPREEEFWAFLIDGNE